MKDFIICFRPLNKLYFQSTENILVTAFSHPSVEGVVLWSFWDQQAWRGRHTSLVDGDEFKVGEKGWKDCEYVFKKKEERYEYDNLALTCGETCDCNDDGSYVSGTLILFVIILC